MSIGNKSWPGPTVGNVFDALTRGAPFEFLPFESRWRELAAWPPDLFAFTSVLLEDSGAYRRVVSPPGREKWPPTAKWTKAVRNVASEWRGSLSQNATPPLPPPPPRVLELGHRIASAMTVSVVSFARKANWDSCAAVLELHAIADETCAGAGSTVIPSKFQGRPNEFWFALNARAVQRGTLANIAPSLVRVLPKFRTPQCGITLRSLSHHLSIDRSEVGVRWFAHESLCDPRQNTLNLLVLPWPYFVGPSDFKPARGRLKNMNREEFGFFDFDPAVTIEPALVERLIRVAKQRGGEVHGVVLPEAALRAAEVEPLQNTLEECGVRMLVTGVRGPRANYASLRWLSDAGWQESRQNKHHRWYLDGRQIQQYHLGSALHPSKRWWENIRVNSRCLDFVAANGWLSICHLICEDLARQDPVAQLVRSVGPSLVIALLLDGPQLEARWPGRYASVLADDPGSSVLSVTSIGMALRSWTSRQAPSRVVALWKDQKNGATEISLERDHQAVLLTLSALWTKEWAADGREDGAAAPVLMLSGVEQIRDPGRESPPPTQRVSKNARRLPAQARAVRRGQGPARR